MLFLPLSHAFGAPMGSLLLVCVLGPLDVLKMSYSCIAFLFQRATAFWTCWTAIHSWVLRKRKFGATHTYL